VAENRHLWSYRPVNCRANRGNCCIFLAVQKRDEPPVARRLDKVRYFDAVSAERSNPFGQAGKFPSGRVPMDDAAGDPARDLRLHFLQRLDRVSLLAGVDRRLDGLDEGPDAADSRMVDGRAIRVAADALLGLRRIRHLKFLVSRSAQ